MTFILSNTYEGAKFSSWIVKLENANLNHESDWHTEDPPTGSSYRVGFDSIETLKDPFGDGIAINSSNNKKLDMPVGKYWFDLRLGTYCGTGTNNYYYYYDFAISGWVSSENKEKWICKATALYLEEQVLNISLRAAQGFYESNNSTDYISVLRRRPWSSWPLGGTPQINKDGSGESGFSTAHPTGASRLLVMRLE